MKMSDVFTEDEINYRGWLDLALTGARSDDALNAAYIAVRDHDALTQLNKELVEALNAMTNFNFKLIRDHNGRHAPWNQMDEEHLHDSHVLINKAKELAE